jgi:putative glycosyltransferase (TIGR04348 family)
MRIFMACPAPPRSLKGNRVTALRWAGILRGLGHQVAIGSAYDGQPAELLLGLHARKSYPAVAAFRRIYPDRPLLVALTGTDLYRDIHHSRRAERSLELADRLLVLQPCAKAELAPHLRSKVRIIIQSASPTSKPGAKRERVFDVCVLGHLRHEKDPFRAALALGHLPVDSRVRLTHAGQAMTPSMADRARAFMKRDHRYRWLAEVSRPRARRILARSRLLVLSSRMEGGANVISEAVADHVPVLASQIPGNIGLLGAKYPGYFRVGDTLGLAKLLHRAETDAAFLSRIESWCAALAPMVAPARERDALAQVLHEVGVQ